MTDDAFKKDGENTYHVPYLMLLGVLICATNDKNKADKFFELCQIELNPSISHEDGEFVDYFPKILEIAYDVMIRHHNENCPETARPDWVKSKEKMGELYGEIFEGFTDKLFMDGEQVVSKLANEKFIERIYRDFQVYLQAHQLSNIVWDRLASSIK